MASEPSIAANTAREKARKRALKGLRIYFAHQRWPRCTMSVIVAVSAGAAFAASFLMLEGGVTMMVVRYPLALLAGWAVFLAEMWLWAKAERRWFLPEHELEKLLHQPDPGERQEVTIDPEPALEWLDLPDLGDVGDLEGCVLGIVMLVLIVLACIATAGVLTIVLSAPALIAEVFLDAVLATALYQRMRNIDERWWLGGAIAQTVKPVAWTALLLIVLGGTLAYIAPGAQSVGGAWRRIQSPTPEIETR
jgi:hypothetical protein